MSGRRSSGRSTRRSWGSGSPRPGWPGEDGDGKLISFRHFNSDNCSALSYVDFDCTFDDKNNSSRVGSWASWIHVVLLCCKSRPNFCCYWLIFLKDCGGREAGAGQDTRVQEPEETVTKDHEDWGTKEEDLNKMYVAVTRVDIVGVDHAPRLLKHRVFFALVALLWNKIRYDISLPPNLRANDPFTTVLTTLWIVVKNQ